MEKQKEKCHTWLDVRWLRALFPWKVRNWKFSHMALVFLSEPNFLGIGSLVVSLIVILLNGCWSGLKGLDLMEVLLGGE